MNRPTLHVEGKDDQNTIIHLLKLNGFDYDTKPWPAHFPELKIVGDVDALLASVETAVMASTGTAVGFVLDADNAPASRWESVAGRLRRTGVVSPASPVPGGFVGESVKYKARVGVWMMPDNRSGGILEDFLRSLVAEADILIGHAQSSTAEARRLGAQFREVDAPKAILHSWLAWQKDPGLPYGTAIGSRYFKHDAPAAAAFAAWVQRLIEGLPATAC
jgi:hypothetical protein